ncbi:MAG: hypothetical protein RLZZ546_3134 [Bacteroidota bacterium]|jgi:hypothetical protein
MNIFKYKDIKFEEIALSKPIKDGGNYISSFSLHKEEGISDLIIQTPTDLIYKDNILCFSLTKKGNFYTFMEELKDRAVDILYKNSEKFFKGKKFSQDYIYRSVETPVDINDEGISIIKNVTLSDKAIVYDYFKDIVKTHSSPYNGVFILKISHLSFIKKTIKINIEILAIKLSLQKNVEIDPSNFLEDNEETTEEDNKETIENNKEIEEQKNIEENPDELSEEDFFV